MTVTFISYLERHMPDRVGSAVIPKLQILSDIIANRDGNRHAERTALIAFAIRILSAALAFISQIILARIMGEFEYGIFVFIWVFAIILGNFSCLGFHTAIIKFLPQYRTQDDSDHIRGLTATARIFAMVIASFAAIVGTIIVFVFENTIPDYYLAPLVLGACALPMIALGDVLDGTSRANNWPVTALSPTYIIRPGLIISFVLLALLFGFEANAKTALLCALAATYFTTLGQFIIVTRKLRGRFSKGARNWDIKNWFAVALPIFIIEGFYYLLTNADVLIVGFFLEPENVAVYFAAAKTMALVHFIYFAVKSGAGPRFAQLAAENKLAELDTFAKQTARWTLYPTILMGGFVLLTGELLLSMFGDAFVDGHTVMFILFAGIFAKALIGPGEVLLTMTGHQKVCTFIYAGALSSNLALNFILIPKYGINGAAFATTSAMLVETILLYLTIKSKFGISMLALSKGNSLMNHTTSTLQSKER